MLKPPSFSTIPESIAAVFISHKYRKIPFIELNRISQYKNPYFLIMAAKMHKNHKNNNLSADYAEIRGYF